MSRWYRIVVLSPVFLSAGLAHAGAVDMLLAPLDDVVGVCDVIEVDLVLTSNDGTDRPFDALDAILTWDPAVLEFIGTDDSRSGGTFFLTGFLPDPDGINDDTGDGEAIYTALALPGDPLDAPPAPDGLIVTTFQFRGLQPFTPSSIGCTPEVGEFGHTRVLFEGLNITGLIDDDDVLQSGTCPGDIDADGRIAIEDLLRVLVAWGPCGGCCPEDIVGTDGVVRIDDLLAVLVGWGSCP